MSTCVRASDVVLAGEEAHRPLCERSLSASDVAVAVAVTVPAGRCMRVACMLAPLAVAVAVAAEARTHATELWDCTFTLNPVLLPAP